MVDREFDVVEHFQLSQNCGDRCVTAKLSIREWDAERSTWGYAGGSPGHDAGSQIDSIEVLTMEEGWSEGLDVEWVKSRGWMPTLIKLIEQNIAEG